MAAKQMNIIIEDETAQQMDYIKKHTGTVYQFQASKAVKEGVKAEYDRLKALQERKK